MSATLAAMRGLAASGAVLAAAAVALGAYASHAASPDDRHRLFMAAAFAFGHGAALAALATGPTRLLARIALAAVFAGTLLFAGSLAAAAFFDAPTRLAPAGGVGMIAGWLMLAVDRARR